MKQEYVDAFLNPAKLVWEKELAINLELVDAEPVADEYTVEEITAVIGVSGSLQGHVLYGFGSDYAQAIAGQMMGEPVDEIDDVCLSVLGELANMVTGNAVTELASAGYSCEISPPVIIESAGTKLSLLGNQQVLVRFSSPDGDLKIRISLTEG